jgi:hypothetical protein
MKHLSFSLLCALLWGVLPRVFAQAPAFDQAVVLPTATFGGVAGSGTTFASAFRTDPDGQGNTYEAGVFYGNTATFGPYTLANPSPSLQRNTLFVARRDAAGTYQWAVSANSSNTLRLSGFEVSANGDVVLTGSFDAATASFGALTLTNSHSGMAGAYEKPDVFVARVSPAGAWLWATRAGSATQTGSDELVTDLQLDAAGNAYVSGTFNGPLAQFGTTTLANQGQGLNADRTDVFVAKMNPTGGWEWAVRGGGPGNDGDSRLAFTAQGDLLVTGFLYSLTGTFGTVNITNPTGGTFVGRLTAAGVWQWVASSSGLDGCSGLGNSGRAVEDASGNIYVKGYHSSPAATFGTTVLPSVVGPTPPTNPCRRPVDLFVAKLSAAGSWLWAATAGGTGDDRAAALAIDAQGGVYVTGAIGGPTAQFGSTTLSNGSNAYVSSNVQTFYDDVFVAKLNASGAWQWAVSAGGAGADVGSEVTIDAAGCLFLNGYFEGGRASFGALSLTQSGGTGTYARFRARLGCRPLAATAAHESTPFALYPNPSRTGNATLTWQLAPGPPAARLLLYSTLGQLVQKKALATATAGTATVTGLAPGVYLARLVDAAGRGRGLTQRLVVQP